MLLLQLPSLLFLFSASTAPFLSSHFPVILFLSPFLYYSNSFSLIFSFIPCFPLFQLQFTTFPILVFLSYCPSFSSSFPILVFLSYRPSLSSLLLLLLLIPSWFPPILSFFPLCFLPMFFLSFLLHLTFLHFPPLPIPPFFSLLLPSMFLSFYRSALFPFCHSFIPIVLPFNLLPSNQTFLQCCNNWDTTDDTSAKTDLAHFLPISLSDFLHIGCRIYYIPVEAGFSCNEK